MFTTRFMDFCLKKIEIVVWNFEELKKELDFLGFYFTG
jgi:hypothetical protein